MTTADDPALPPPPSQDAAEALEKLVAQAAGGDRQAQDELLQRYWPLIRQTVLSRKHRLGQRVAAREETQDLQQAAAIKILARLPQHEWQGASAFVAWIKKLAAMEVIDALRHHGAQKRDVQAETPLDLHQEEPQRLSRSPESRYDDEAKLQVLLQQVAQLKPEYGTALLMHHPGYSHADIGDVLECTPEAARKLVTRARTKLVKLRT